jgi:hypothetical protein
MRKGYYWWFIGGYCWREGQYEELEDAAVDEHSSIDIFKMCYSVQKDKYNVWTQCIF